MVLHSGPARTGESTVKQETSCLHDLVIRGGTIVDGSGAARFAGDIAIDGGRITQAGGIAGAARRVTAAAGALVTPGCWQRA